MAMGVPSEGLLQKKTSLNSKVKGTTKKNCPFREIFMTMSVPCEPLPNIFEFQNTKEQSKRVVL
jgi:hypothetical protein